jgi:hypothetical protein
MPMGLIPGRKPSKKQRATRAAGKAGKKVTKAKAVQKAPKTAAAVWAGKRSGKVIKGVAVVVIGLVTFKAIRSKAAQKEAPAAGTPFPDTTPVPDPGQSATGSAINGSAPQPDPAAPFSPPVTSGTTPPQGDKAAELTDEESSSS